MAFEWKKVRTKETKTQEIKKVKSNISEILYNGICFQDVLVDACFPQRGQQKMEGENEIRQLVNNHKGTHFNNPTVVYLGI